MQAATIKLFLVTGEPDGIRTAELSNWTGKAIAGPRSQLSDLFKREELINPGVYFLTGVDPESDLPTLYIGEAESVVKRLRKHRERDDWNQVVVFVSKDENLTKAHIKYLEGALIILGNDAKRAAMKNSANSGAKLPESDQVEMDVFLNKILQLLPILGIDLFKMINTKDVDPNQMLYCKIKGIEARGKLTTNGFVVFKGSQAVSRHRASAKRLAAKRDMLLADGVLIEKGDHWSFSTDCEFTSPSAAASIVCGGSSNGLKRWKDSNGQALKSLDS